MWFSIISSIILLFIATFLFTSELRAFPIYRSFSFFFLFEALYIVANFIVTEIWPNITNMSTIHNIGHIIFGTYILISLSKYMQNVKRTQSDPIDKKESVVNTSIDTNTDKNKAKPSVEDSAKKEPAKTTATKSKTTSTRKRTTTSTTKSKTAGTSANKTTKKRTTTKSTTSKTTNTPVVEKEPSPTKETSEQTVVKEPDASI